MLPFLVHRARVVSCTADDGGTARRRPLTGGRELLEAVGQRQGTAGADVDACKSSLWRLPNRATMFV